MKVVKIVSISLFSLICIVLLGSPFLVKPLLEKNSKTWLGRKVTLEEFSLNYFTGTVKIIDFKLYEDDETSTFVSFDTLLLDTEPFQYFTSKIVVEELYLKSLNATVIKKNDSAFNFDSLVDFFASPNDTLQKEVTDEDFKFSFSNIEFSNADIEFIDQVVGDNFEIDAINFMIPNIEWNQLETSEADLNFSFTDGGEFKSSTQFDPVSGDFSANIGVSSLDVSSFNEYVKKSLKVGNLEGFFNTELSFIGNTKKFDNLEIKGTIDLSDVSLLSTDKKPIVAFKNLHCPIVKVEPLKQNFELGDIVLEELFVDFIKYKNTTNLELLVKDSKPEKVESIKKTEKTSKKELFYSIASFKLKGGKVDLMDATTSKPFYYKLSRINTDVDSIHSNSTWLKTHTSMTLNKSGGLVLDFNFNPKRIENELEMVYDISGLKLKDLNIYCVDYMGTPIYKGEMYYKAKTSLFDGMLKSENKIIVHNISLGEKSGGEYNVPLKFGVFLMKDKEGVVHMDVPVEGNMNESNVDIRGVIWDAFRNLIIKTVASPGKLLGGIIGGKQEDLEEIRYSYLDTVLNTDRLKQLKSLRSLRKNKKGLEISLEYVNDIENEKRQLAVFLLKEKNKKLLM